MKSKKFLLLAAVLVFLSAPFLASNELSVRIHPEEIFNRLGKRQTSLTANDLIDLAFAASGTEAEKLPQFRYRMKKILTDADLQLFSITDPYTLGEDLLEYLHQTILSGYSENQSSMEILLESGRYNCVSSSVLYLIFARYFDLEVEGVATADHTFCSVKTGKGDIDVETTTVYGFDPGIKKEFTSAFGETGFSYVPPGNYRSRWIVGDRKLISYILQNRISLLERQKKYHLAAELAVDRFALVDDEETRGDMVKEFVNYAALLNERGSYEEGLDFISQVRGRYGNSPEYIEVSSILVNNKVVEFTRRKAYEEALVFLEGMGKGEILDEKTWKRLHKMITEKSMVDVITGGSFETALDQVEESLEMGKIDQEQYREYIVYLYGRQGEELAARKRWIEAIAAVKAGLEKGGGDSRLKQAVAAFEHNFAAEKHNEFARLFNAGLREEALRLLEEALSQMPESDILRRDYQTINQ